MNDISQRVKMIISSYLDVPADEVVENASFIEDLGADSLEVVELVMAFEDEFAINIADDTADKLVTVGDAIKYLEAAQA